MSDFRPTLCGDNEVYVPTAECTDCEKLELRVRVLEECCSEVSEELDKKLEQHDIIAGENVTISYEEDGTVVINSSGGGGGGSITKTEILTAMGYNEIVVGMTDTQGTHHSWRIMGVRADQANTSASTTPTPAQTVFGTVTMHGAVLDEYEPLSDTYTYVFNGTSERPWHSKQSSITALEFGSQVAPTSIAYWLQSCPNLESIDWTNFVGSNCTSARAFVAGTKLTTFSLPEMPNLTNIRYICNACPNLVSVDMSAVNATGITEINASFQACYLLEEIDLSGLAGTIDACSNAFSNATNGADMALETIYVNPNLDFSQATAYNNVFRACTSLVGGQGTTFDSSFIGKQYARIDNPPTELGYFTQK